MIGRCRRRHHKHAGNIKLHVWTGSRPLLSCPAFSQEQEVLKLHFLFQSDEGPEPQPAQRSRPGQNLPSGKNQSACWMMGSMMATTCTEVAAAISARLLQASETRAEMRPRQDEPMSERPLRLLPLSLGPQQVGSQDDGHVARCHFVRLAVLSQSG